MCRIRRCTLTVAVAQLIVSFDSAKSKLPDSLLRLKFQDFNTGDFDSLSVADSEAAKAGLFS